MTFLTIPDFAFNALSRFCAELGTVAVLPLLLFVAVFAAVGVILYVFSRR